MSIRQSNVVSCVEYVSVLIDDRSVDMFGKFVA